MLIVRSLHLITKVILWGKDLYFNDFFGLVLPTPPRYIFFDSSTFASCLPRILVLHEFSIIFKSKDLAGHSKTRIFFCFTAFTKNVLISENSRRVLVNLFVNRFNIYLLLLNFPVINFVSYLSNQYLVKSLYRRLSCNCDSFRKSW